MIAGACNCGAVGFEAQIAGVDVYVCHCSICRRATGTNGMAVVIAANRSFRWIRGEAEISTWKKPDADWQRWFCRICGSTLPGHNDPERMFIPAGLITRGGEALRVRHHIFVGSKAPWDEIGDQGQRHHTRIGE
jgi:hypothetical protein